MPPFVDPFEDKPAKKAVGGFVDPFEDTASVSETGPTPSPRKKDTSPGFMSKVGEAWTKRSENIWKMGPTRPLAMGQGIGFLGDVAGAGIESLYKGFMPEEAQKAIGGVVGPAAKTVADVIKPATDLWSGFKEKYPGTALDVESGMNIMGLFPAGKGIKAVGGEAFNVAKDVKNLVLPAGKTAIDAELERTAVQGLKKAGIKPTPGKAGTAIGIEGEPGTFYQKGARAVKNITTDTINRGEPLPKDLPSFSSAIHSSEQEQAAKITHLLADTGQHKISTETQQQALKDFLGSKSGTSLKIHNPQVVEDIKGRIARYKEQGFMTPAELNEDIVRLNDTIYSLQSTRPYDVGSLKDALAKVAHGERQTLNQFITDLKGPGFQEIKKDWGSLLEIRDQVAKRVLREIGKSKTGFIDALATGTAFSALLHANPQLLVTIMAAEGSHRLFKFIKDPNRIIKNMFGEAEKLTKKGAEAGQPFEARSAAGRGIQSLIQGKQPFPTRETGFPDILPPKAGPFDPWANQEGWKRPLAGLIEYNPKKATGIPLLTPEFMGGKTEIPRVVGEPSVKGTPRPPGGEYPKEYVLGGVQPVTSFAPGAKKADQTIWLPKPEKTVEGKPSALKTPSSQAGETSKEPFRGGVPTGKAPFTVKELPQEGAGRKFEYIKDGKVVATGHLLGEDMTFSVGEDFRKKGIGLEVAKHLVDMGAKAGYKGTPGGVAVMKKLGMVDIGGGRYGFKRKVIGE